MATTIRRSETILTADLDGEMVMMDAAKGLYYGLDLVGSQILNLTEQSITVADLRDLLVQRFEISPERCETEVIQFIEELLEHGIVEKVGDTR